MDWLPLLVAAIPGIVSLVTVIYQSRREEEVMDAEATKAITEAAAGAVKMYKDQLEKLESQVADLAKLKEDCLAELRRLRRLLITAGIDPNNSPE